MIALLVILGAVVGYFAIWLVIFSRIKKPIKTTLTIVYLVCTVFLFYAGLYGFADAIYPLVGLSIGLGGGGGICYASYTNKFTEIQKKKNAESFNQALERSPMLKEAISDITANWGYSNFKCFAHYTSIALQYEGGGLFFIAGGVIMRGSVGIATNDIRDFPFMSAAKRFVYETHSTKQSSVVGRAVAGGIIAGGAGAVVGAISAANKNAQGGVTQTDHYYGGYHLSVKDPIKSRRTPIAAVYVPNKVTEKIGYPNMLSRNEQIQKDGYIEFTGFRSANNTKAEIQQLINYINAVLNMSLED